MNKVKTKFENLNRQQGGFDYQDGQKSSKAQKEDDSNVIEAEFRKL